MGLNKNNERKDQIFSLIKSESAPPLPCIEYIECIVYNAFKKKRCISANITQPLTHEALCVKKVQNNNISLFKPETCLSRNALAVENLDQYEETA